MKIKIWDALNQEAEDATEVEISEWSNFDINGIYLNELVRDFVEKRWGNNDYLETTEVNVMNPAGAILEFTVTAEESICFRSSPRDKNKR